MECINVGIAELKIAGFPNRLRTSGLGSCVGVALYDPKTSLIGLAHVMLPESALSRGGPINTAKFADTAIPELVQLLVNAGASQHRLVAKMAGGAQMFKSSLQSDVMRIGLRNVEACREMLSRYKIPIVAEDTGGSCGRTIEIDSRTGKLWIRTVNEGEKEI